MEILSGIKTHLEDNIIHCDICECVIKVNKNDIKEFEKPKVTVCGYLGEEDSKNTISISKYYVQCPICPNKIAVRNQLHEDLKDEITYDTTFCVPNATEQDIHKIMDYMCRNNIKYYKVDSVKNDE